MKSVLVVGAGVAGLVAAVRLVEAGCAVTLLEASDRVGGRVRTEYVGDVAVELGAEFVHGKPPEMFALLDELGLETYELGGTDVTYSPDGALDPESDDDSDEDEGPFAAMERMAQWNDAHATEDLSFTEYLSRAGISREDAAPASSFVEGFNAADASRISVKSLAVQQRAEDSIEGDASFHVRGGYARLPLALAERFARAGGLLRLNAVVAGVTWSRGAVTVSLASGEEVSAEAAVIALPLGVLQSDAVRWSPAPGAVLRHAARMVMGQVCRINLVFKRRWWAEREDLKELSFLLPTERLSGKHFNVFWSGFPSLVPVLTAWSGGPSSRAFDGLNDHEIAHAACADLARIFELTQEQVLDELLSHHRYDWSRDPLFCGAYSWVAVGGADASARMGEPVESTLFFAGEHTDVTGHWGTVHGALRSGMRAAAQVLKV